MSNSKNKRFYVRDKHGVYLLAKNQQADGRVETVAEIVEYYGVEEVELNYELSEEEIKGYDENYWHFAIDITTTDL